MQQPAQQDRRKRYNDSARQDVNRDLPDQGVDMGVFDAHGFALTLALVGIVIVVAALLSGLIERSGLPQVAVFLALGATLGPYGLRMLNVTLDSSLLRVVA